MTDSSAVQSNKTKKHDLFNKPEHTGSEFFKRKISDAPSFIDDD